tara:strand:- start:567 stop:1181 length:615 start_codon:yes stop_codon:yes gene_type:complete
MRINTRPGIFKGGRPPITIGKMKIGVSVQARMTQIAWQNAFVDKRFIAKMIAPALKRAAGYIRAVARNGIGRRRPRRNVSPARGYPYSHQDGKFSLRNIQHHPPEGSTNLTTMSRLVGVMKQTTKEGWRSKYLIPKMVHDGGTGTKLMRVGTHQKYINGEKKWINSQEKNIRLRFRERPFMELALKKSMNKVPHLFRGIVANVR